jgi:hypothetical protein
MFPRLAKAQRILVQQHPIVLMNPFPQGKNMARASSSMSAEGGSQGPPTPGSPLELLLVEKISIVCLGKGRDLQPRSDHFLSNRYKTLSSLPHFFSDSSGLHHEIFYAENFSYSG